MNLERKDVVNNNKKFLIRNKLYYLIFIYNINILIYNGSQFNLKIIYNYYLLY